MKKNFAFGISLFNDNLRDISIIVFVSLIIVLPFLNQAYNIDDYVYLSAAEQYNKNGFESLRGESEQEGVMYPNYYITHPLLWPWFLASYMNFFNTDSEVVLHLISIINLIIIGLSSLLISRRFSRKPLLSVLFFLFIPAVVLMSHLMMTDIPTTAFFLLALSLHIEGIERKSVLLLTFSGIAAAISAGISYQALFIIFLFIFYNLACRQTSLQEKEKKLTSFISSAIPIFCFIIWSIFTWKKFGIAHPFIAFQWASMAGRDLLLNFFPKFISNINALGAASVFPAFIFFIYFLDKRFRNFLFISFLISLSAVFVFAGSYSAVQKILFVIYFTAGFFLILRFLILIKDSIKAKDKKNEQSHLQHIFLAGWFISFFAVTVLTMPIGVARYLLPCLLPLIIIVVDDADNLFKGTKQFKIAAAAGLILTILWSTLCSVADYQFMGTYRDVSKKISEKYKNKNVWFCSDGLKWYMEKEGFKPLLFGDKRTKKGDLIVISSQLWPYRVPEIMEKTKLINKISYDSNYPLRTMNFDAHAGFYDQADALLPFSLTRGGYEEFSIYEIIK